MNKRAANAQNVLVVHRGMLRKAMQTRCIGRSSPTGQTKNRSISRQCAKISRAISLVLLTFIAIPFGRNPMSFLKAHDVPVNGTEQALVSFEFDRHNFCIAFNDEFCTTLRTVSLESQLWNSVAISHDASS
jgi:hypothetical protein